MTRLIGPDEASRTVFLTSGSNAGKALAQGMSVPLYADAALSVPADVRSTTDDLISGTPPTVIVDAWSQIPLFKFPDGADVVYTSVNGGPAVPLYARTDDRLDALAVAVSGTVQRVNHTGTQAISTVVGLQAALDAAPLKARLYANVKDFGALGNGTGNDAPAIQAAINSLPTSGLNTGGTVYFPVGNYRTTTPIVLRNGIRLIGEGQRASRISVEAGTGMFTWTAHMAEVKLDNLFLNAVYSGHVFAPTGDMGIATVTVSNCAILQQETNKSIMNHVGSSDYDNVDFINCFLHRIPGATVPAFNIINSGGAANANHWINCWAHSNGSANAPFFYVESSTVNSYAYDNVWQNITGEQNTGGLIHLYGAFGATIDTVLDWDATTYTADLIKLSASASAPNIHSRYATISNSGRRGGTLAGGVYDINLEPGKANRCTLIAPNHSSEPVSGLRMNFADADQHTLLGVPPQGPVWSGQPTGVGHYFGSSVQFAAGVRLGSTFRSVGTGSPEGAVTGSPGDQFTRTDGGVGSTFYVKETGTGNTGWAAK